MDFTVFLIWFGISIFFIICLIIGFILLIVISKKTHGLIEFKSSTKGQPMSVFFQDNRYCEWKVIKPEAGLVEDKEHGTFVIVSTYVDKKTKNVLVPFNSNYGFSLNVKASKMADDLDYFLKEQREKKTLKREVLSGEKKETDGINTLRTSVNFSPLKNFVPPILPHNIKSKIINTVNLRLENMGVSNAQNIILLAISALGALILGGIVLKFMLG